MDLEYLNNLHDEIKKFNKELLDEQKDLNKKLSDVDKKISDLYHEIEFTDVKHISEGYLFYKKLKILLGERRQFKKQIGVISHNISILPSDQKLNEVMKNSIKQLSIYPYVKKVN